jgi:hypothetical protein
MPLGFYRGRTNAIAIVCGLLSEGAGALLAPHARATPTKQGAACNCFSAVAQLLQVCCSRLLCPGVIEAWCSVCFCCGCTAGARVDARAPASFGLGGS